MMKFYDALQLDPSILKRKIAACDTKKEKIYYWTAIAVRSALIVGFAIVFISLLSQVFGADNIPRKNRSSPTESTTTPRPKNTSRPARRRCRSIWNGSWA